MNSSVLNHGKGQNMLLYNMASKMATKDEIIYRFIIHKFIFRFFMNFVFIAMGYMFLCNWLLLKCLNFTVNSSMASKVATRMENPIYWCYFAVF